MFNIHKLFQLITPTRLYSLILCLVGITLFLTSYSYPIFHYSSSEWVLLFSMLGASFILYFFTFQLPPRGNKQSMDSAVYLACIFIYDSSFALTVLLFNTIIFTLIERNVSWKKHLINYSIYSIMVINSGLVYQSLGGSAGSLDNGHLIAYLLSLIVYFMTNVLCISVLLGIASRKNMYHTTKNMLQQSMIVYICTLILSLILTVLIVHNGMLGLLLFTGLSILLSHSFNQMFTLFIQIEERANIDQRTGLFNHSYFENILDNEMKQAKTVGSHLSLAMIDIDDFKKYNDQFGHIKGDQLLALTGKILKEESEAVGAVASRYGGEEFTVLMPTYDEQKAFILINRIRKKLNDTYIEGAEIFPHGCISFSAGIARYQLYIHDKSELVNQADQALYYAKKQGKNLVHIHNNHAVLEQEMDIAQDVRDIEQQLKIFLYKDIGTFNHSKRVYRYAVGMSSVLELNCIQKRKFVLGALIHDIGKLEVPWEILQKKSKLTREEWSIIKNHVTWGKDIALTSEKYKDLAPFIELHHERYDGMGYPHGFKQEEIPRLCRMLTIIDSFDAMTSERPYQRTKTFSEAISELEACSGSQFDPELTKIFIEYIVIQSSQNSEFSNDMQTSEAL